jgi:hypothetical protein
VADARLHDVPNSTPDYHPHPDGRLLPGSVMIALAVEGLIQNKPIRRPQFVRIPPFTIAGNFMMDLPALAIGAVLGIALARRAGWRVLLEVAAICLLAVSVAMIYRYARGLYAPVVAAAGLVLAAEMVALARRSRTV